MMAASWPKASIVVCTYDESRIDDLNQCIASLLKQKFSDFEVLVVVDHNEKLYKTLVAKYED